MQKMWELAGKIGWGYLLVTTGSLSGYAPVAPGTIGTLVAMPLYLLLARTDRIVYMLVTLILFVVGMQGADKIEEVSQQQDPGIVVIDEIVGYLVTMFMLPKGWLFPVVGFFVFRVLDIVKPYPIRQLDLNPHLKGFGIMVDDALAGVYGNILLLMLAKVLTYAH